MLPNYLSSGISGRKCKVCPSNAANNQPRDARSTACLIRVISLAVKPPAPDLSCTKRISIASESLGRTRAITASTMPVRGAPVRPSKKITFHPFSLHQADSASLLDLSDLSARYFGLCRVVQAFFAAVLLARKVGFMFDDYPDYKLFFDPSSAVIDRRYSGFEFAVFVLQISFGFRISIFGFTSSRHPPSRNRRQSRRLCPWLSARLRVFHRLVAVARLEAGFVI